MTGCVKHRTILAEEQEQDLGDWRVGALFRHLAIDADIRISDIRCNEKFIEKHKQNAQ